MAATTGTRREKITPGLGAHGFFEPDFSACSRIMLSPFIFLFAVAVGFALLFLGRLVT